MSEKHRSERVLEVLGAAAGPMTVKGITAAMGESTWQDEEKQRGALRPMVAAGQVERSEGRPATFWLTTSRPKTAPAPDLPVGEAEACSVPADDDLPAAPEFWAHTADYGLPQSHVAFAPEPEPSVDPVPAATEGPDTAERMLAVVLAQGTATIAQMARGAGILSSTAGVLARVLRDDGYLTQIAETPAVFRYGPRTRARAVKLATEEAMRAAELHARAAPEVERTAFDVSRPGSPPIADIDLVDEIEAEKVWQLAGQLRAANTTWGVDMGLDADVREARALMAEARRQVRGRLPLGQHYMEQKPCP